MTLKEHTFRYLTLQTPLHVTTAFSIHTCVLAKTEDGKGLRTKLEVGNTNKR